MTSVSKATLRRTEKVLKHAENYQEWYAASCEFDRLTGLNEWKHEEHSNDYDYRLIRNRLDELKRLRESEDIGRLVYTLHENLHGNLGNMGNPALYTYGLSGTKQLIVDYVDEVVNALNYICDHDFDDFQLGDKIQFFKRTGRAFGRSALLLSGGATLGMFHLGVVKGLWDEGLLPRVMSGSSAGSIIASVACSNTEEELKDTFNPEYMAIQAWRSMGLKGAIRGKSVMDGEQLETAIATNVGDMTFEEAFEKTGRILNIPVSPTAQHQQGRLLNYLASPNVFIRRASRASCAVPGLFAPVELECKSFVGEHEPYMPDHLWCDGSIASDLPMLRLARFHNANHYIVSQTNPHILPFMTNDTQRKRSGILALTRQAVTSGAKVYLNHIVSMARDSTDSYGVGLMVDKAASIANQKYKGDINVLATHSVRQWRRVLSNPTPKDMEAFISNGQKATWPIVERVRLQTKVSRTFDDCLARLKAEHEVEQAAKAAAQGKTFRQRWVRDVA